MPAPESLRASLASIAEQAVAISMAWHAILAVVLFALVVGWRPSQRLAALLLTFPLASVSAAAWSGMNPFNGSVLGVATALLAVGALRLPATPVQKSSAGPALAALMLVGFSWVYPHFVSGESLAYLYASPLGVLPCPTLACVIGLTSLARGFRAPAWSTALALLGLFYGLFGTFVLGVIIDTFLTIGSLTLLAMAWSRFIPGRGQRAVAAKAP